MPAARARERARDRLLCLGLERARARVPRARRVRRALHRPLLDHLPIHRWRERDRSALARLVQPHELVHGRSAIHPPHPAFRETFVWLLTILHCLQDGRRAAQQQGGRRELARPARPDHCAHPAATDRVSRGPRLAPRRARRARVHGDVPPHAPARRVQRCGLGGDGARRAFPPGAGGQAARLARALSPAPSPHPHRLVARRRPLRSGRGLLV